MPEQALDGIPTGLGGVLLKLNAEILHVEFATKYLIPAGSEYLQVHLPRGFLHAVID